MNQSNESRHGRRRLHPAPDVLEDRMVLSAGEGSTFAIMPGTVAGPGMVSSAQVPDRPHPVHLAQERRPNRRRHRHHAGRRRLRRPRPPPLSSPRSSRSRMRPDT